MLTHRLFLVSQGEKLLLYMNFFLFSWNSMQFKYFNLKQGICCSGLVTCPFCRNTSIHFDANTLPNNNYALHMLKLTEKKAEQATSGASQQ